MSGVQTDEYAVARRALLDALDALKDQLDALVLVGAQAVYLQCGDADLLAAEHTTDADVAVDPRALRPQPEIATALRSAGFYLTDARHGGAVGIWTTQREIAGVPALLTVDLLTPAALGGAGRRAARLPPHERGAVLKVRGLEPAMLDNRPMTVGALEKDDARAHTIRVAGPAALLVSKCVKLGERLADAREGGRRADRLKPKDALDVLRILRSCDAAKLAADLDRLQGDDLAGPVTAEALSLLPDLFGSAASRGSTLAAEAAYPEPPAVIAESCAALAQRLLNALGRADR